MYEIKYPGEIRGKTVLLRSGNCILKVLGIFTNHYWAKEYIEYMFPDFKPEGTQWSKFQSPEFITIE